MAQRARAIDVAVDGEHKAVRGNQTIGQRDNVILENKIVRARTQRRAVRHGQNTGTERRVGPNFNGAIKQFGSANVAVVAVQHQSAFSDLQDGTCARDHAIKREGEGVSIHRACTQRLDSVGQDEIVGPRFQRRVAGHGDSTDARRGVGEHRHRAIGDVQAIEAVGIGQRQRAFTHLQQRAGTRDHAGERVIARA